MWMHESRDWPATNVQVVGIVTRADRSDEVAWWTRTDDGWYVSDVRGSLGHRDALTKDKSRGPNWWQHAPKHT